MQNMPRGCAVPTTALVSIDCHCLVSPFANERVLPSPSFYYCLFYFIRMATAFFEELLFFIRELASLKNTSVQFYWHDTNLDSASKRVTHEAALLNDNRLKTYSFLRRWFFGKTKRVDADRLLLMPHNGNGSFLIRDRENNLGEFALTSKLNKWIRR